MNRQIKHRPRTDKIYKHARACLFPILAALASACATSPPPARLDDLRVNAPPAPDRPAALVNDQPVSWDLLHPALAEAAGSIALEELILDRLIAAEYRARFAKGPEDLTSQQLAVERDFLTATLRRSGATPEQSALLVENLRKERGLGNARFTALLRRNAMLRALVTPSIEVAPEMVRQRFDVRFGPRYRARIITTATEAEAADALRAIRNDQASLWLDAYWALRLSPEAAAQLLRTGTTFRFAALASRLSTDESRTRGGEIEPISPADPAYSPALRSAVAGLVPGQLSRVIALEPGFGILLLEEALPAEPTTLEAQRADIEEELRRRQERLLMDSLARRLIQSARVVVMDPALAWSWQNRRGTEPAK